MSKVPVFASAMNVCQVRAEYRITGPAGFTESRTTTVPVAGATSTQAPLEILRADLRHASGPGTSIGDMFLAFAMPSIGTRTALAALPRLPMPRIGCDDIAS